MSILQFFDFFLPDEFLYSLHHSNTFVLLLVSTVYLLTFENESKLVNILICCFLSVLIKVHRGTQISQFCNSFMNTGLSFYINTSFIYILQRQLIRISYPPF